MVYINNKLSIYLNKTVSETVLFGSPQRLKNCSKLKIKCEHLEIASATEVKYLGQILDQSFNVEKMAIHITKKIVSIV